MPEYAGRHYMNPAYGRALTLPPENDDADAQECAQNGDLKHVDVHIQRDGGFSVHAHYQHKRAGHHSVESRHSSSHEAAEQVKGHLRGHEARRARKNGSADSSDES